MHAYLILSALQLGGELFFCSSMKVNNPIDVEFYALPLEVDADMMLVVYQSRNVCSE